MIAHALVALVLQASAPAAPPPLPAGVPPVQEPRTEAAPAPAVEPWDRSFSEGLAEVRKLAGSGATDEAEAVAERLVAPNALARRIEDLVRGEGWRARAGRALESLGDALDLLGPPPAVRAEAWHARAVALRLGAEAAHADLERGARRDAARQAFERARLLSGPGPLRLDATYEQGALDLAAGEEQRARIPEISKQPAAPPAPAAGAAPGSARGSAPDPLQLARAAYLSARERFVERLRMDWHDRDTQADVELVQRRLRELDAIERQREQQKKDQEQQQKDEQKDQEKQDQKDSSQDQKPDESKDQQKPDQPKPQDPGQDQPKPDPQEPPQDGKKPEESPAPEPKPVEPKEDPAMSKEERVQLLERLDRIEDLQKELQEKLKRMRKVSVEKDW